VSEFPSEKTAGVTGLGKAFAMRVQEATALLREIRDDRRLMAELDEELHRELLTLAGQVARPGPYAKRELAREARKRRKRKLRDADERILAGTGIRAKRRELVMLGATPTAGRLLARASLDLAGATSAAIVDGRIYIRTRTGVACHDLRRQTATGEEPDS
jgi:hypothetical protein